MRFRIHRLKDSQRENFRWAAHTGGEATIKAKDYERAGELDSPTPYAAWKQMAAAGTPMHPGDVLEVLAVTESEIELWIAKYIGFERAQWYTPAPRTELATSEIAGAEIQPVFGASAL